MRRVSGVSFRRALWPLEQIRLSVPRRARGTSRHAFPLATLIEQDPPCSAERVRLASPPKSPEIFASQGLASIELACGEAGIGSIEDERRWHFVNRHLREVAKPILEATSNETELRQMEVRFCVTGVDSQNLPQEVLGAIRPLGVPLRFGIEEQAIAPLGTELARFPEPDLLPALLLFGLAPERVGHGRRRRRLEWDVVNVFLEGLVSAPARRSGTRPTRRQRNLRNRRNPGPRIERLGDVSQFLAHLWQHVCDFPVGKPLLEIVGQICQIADQLPNLRHRILNGPSAILVRNPRPRVRRVRGFTFLGMFTKPLSIALFDERTYWKLPPLLGAGTQPRKLSRIHAEGARHLDLPGIELTHRLRVPPNLFVVLPLLLRHREGVMRVLQEESRSQFSANRHSVWTDRFASLRCLKESSFGVLKVY
jgi:hypothetical protein